MKIKLLRPNGNQWTVGDYIKRITVDQNISEWKNELGSYIHQCIVGVIPRLYVNIVE